jgi:hypothetical protein
MASDLASSVLPVTQSTYRWPRVRVGEGHQDYDRDLDRTVVKEREPFERYWHSKKDHNDGTRSTTVITTATNT